MAFTQDWSVSEPTDATYAYEIDDEMRSIRVDVADRLASLMYGFTAGENSYVAHAKKMVFRSQSSVTQPAASYGAVYIKDVSGTAELFWQDSSGSEKQLTSGGKINLAAADVSAALLNDSKIQLRNNQYLKSTNAAGTSTVDLIKASTGDKAILPNDVQLATTVPPTVDAQVPCKKYVDDSIAAVFQSDVAVGTTNISTNTGDWADMTDMSVTMTTTGGNVLVMFTATFEARDEDSILGLRLDLDGSPYCTQQHWLHHKFIGSSAGQDCCLTLQYLFTSVSAGSHTVKVQWKDVTDISYQDGSDFPRVLTVMECPS
jgi:hypothetical protein